LAGRGGRDGCRLGKEKGRTNVRKRIKVSASLIAASTLLGAMVLTLGGSVPAQADYAPGPHDIIGVGSDTLQYLLDFADDGDPNGDAGFNTSGNFYKVVSFDATADSNARAAYLNNSTDATLLPLDPTAVLRAGTYPVERPNGSSAGINALLADTSAAYPTINFVRMSSAPTTTEGATAQSEGFGGLEVVTIGQENLEMAASLATNAPAGLSAQQLVDIYQCTPGFTQWTDVGGTSTDTIIPAIPQAGSGTRSTFLSELQAANGGTAITLGGCVVTVEENDPTGITGNTDPNDVIEPFSGSRLNLWNGVSGDTAQSASTGVGYFHVPTTAYPGGASIPPNIQLLTGKPSDGNSVFDDDRDLYIVYPYIDQTSTTPWQPGSKLNWAEALFCNPGGTTPWIDSPAGLDDISQAGADPDYSCASTPLT
jgi:ABC-type phosphate transport system substrate-binding protein